MQQQLWNALRGFMLVSWCNHGNHGMAGFSSISSQACPTCPSSLMLFRPLLKLFMDRYRIMARYRIIVLTRLDRR
jgi:hypothetical protein